MPPHTTLVGIRSKAAQLPVLEPVEASTLQLLKLANLLGGSLLLLLLGSIRWLSRRASGGYKPRTAPSVEEAA